MGYNRKGGGIYLTFVWENTIIALDFLLSFLHECRVVNYSIDHQIHLENKSRD